MSNREGQGEWKQLSSKTIYKNRWLRLREDQVIRPDGTEGMYSVIDSGPSVFIIALNKKDEFVLIQQYRYPLGRFLWELPAGGIDHADVLEGAKRELKEETGIVARTWKELGTFYAMDGICSEIAHVVLAEDVTKGIQDRQPDENIRDLQWISFTTARTMIANGEITDAQSIAAIMKAAIALGKI